jgi:fumarate reductase flavoprotein subunit
MKEPGSDDSGIIVAGAGGCGFVATLVASRKGASVLLLEKTDKPGGGTAFSTRGIRAAGTRFQRAVGVADSPEQFAADILGRNCHESDVALTKRLAEQSSRLADFLADVAGIQFIVGDFFFGHSARRSHSWKEDKTITDFLFEAVQRERNIQVRFSTPVLSLMQAAGGTVTGVMTENGGIEAYRVILASGGFGASRELLSEYIPEAVDIPFPGHYGSTGEGIKMGLAAGAAVENTGSFQPYPAYIGPRGQSVSPQVAMSGGVMVDRQGKRFVDETRYPGGLSSGILALPGKEAYEVLDERVYQLHRALLEEFLSSGLLHQAPTPGELAGKLGIDADGLEQTVRDCNSAAGGGPGSFGRTLPAAFKAPFYGIKVRVALYHTQGGLKVDIHGRVLRPDGSIIPNLYAGGGAAAGVSGTGMDGYLPGNGQLASLGLGMLAGEHAAASLKETV